MVDDSFLDLTLLEGARRDLPLARPWPAPNNPGGLIEFATAAVAVLRIVFRTPAGCT